MDADRSNIHRSPSPTPRAGDAHGGGDLQLRGDSSVTSAVQLSARSVTSGIQLSARSSSSAEDDTLPSITDTGSRGSFWKSTGKAIEKAVDSSVLGVALPADESYDQSDYDEGESEVGTSVVSEALTTLAERIAMQRERQVAFLKNKGLIGDDGSSLRGGAGGKASPGSPNSRAPTPRRTLSSTRSLTSRWSPHRKRPVSVAQDEV